MEEVWKDISGFEGYYQVSTLGKIRSISRYVSHKNGGSAFKNGKVLSLRKNTAGYSVVNLAKEGKICTKTVHRLVAIAFLPNPNNYPFINHINENKEDNRIENLEWCTPRQNSEAFFTQRNTVYQYDLQGNLLHIWHSQTRAAEAIGGDSRGIVQCCRSYLARGRSLKTYCGYIWTYSLLSSEELKRRTTNERRIRVAQLDIKGNVVHTYSNVTEAANAVGCSLTAISNALKGKLETVKGYKWIRN